MNKHVARVIGTVILLGSLLIPAWFVFVPLAILGVLFFKWYFEGFIIIACYLLWYHHVSHITLLIILFGIILLITVRSVIIPRFLRV